MKFVKELVEYDALRARLGGMLLEGREYPQRIFHEQLNYFHFVTFDEMRMRLFFDHIRSFLYAVGRDCFTYLVLDPSPEQYGVIRPRRFKAVQFLPQDTDFDFSWALNTNSGGPEPDSMMDNSNIICVFDEVGDWCVVGDRSSDIGVCAFASKRLASSFAEAYGDDLLVDQRCAAEFAYKSDPLKFMVFISSYS